MAAIDQLRDRFQQTWTSINEGWHRLTDAAGQAITRFTPGKRQAEEEGQDLAERNVGWGLLAAEVSERGDEIEVRLEAPGLKREDFEVECSTTTCGSRARSAANVTITAAAIT